MDTKFHYVMCSHEGIDPEDVKQITESKCLASAAKLGGVTVKIQSKTVQSLSGADSGEIAEIQPLIRDVRLEWTERYLESIQNGFRLWLRGRVEKSKVVSAMPQNTAQFQSVSTPGNKVTDQYKRGTLFLTTVPRADKVLIGGDRGQRVVEVESNVVQVELKEGDQWVAVKKNRYREAKRELPSWRNGEALSLTVNLEEEI